MTQSLSTPEGEDWATTDVLRTYSLSEVAAAHLPTELKDPVRWLTMRLSRGEIRGVQIGRYWRMRESDVEYMLSKYSNDAKASGRNVALAPTPASLADGFGISLRSRRRRCVA